MARGNQNINDQLFRTRGRNAAETRESQEEIRKRQIRSWIILVSVALAIVLGIHFLGRYGKGKEISMSKLPCYANQNVTPFRDGLLYYDGASIHHLSSSGTIRWSFPAGNDVKFSVGPTHMALWSGTQLFLVDRNGNATYNESMEAKVQFVRVGERYAAVVVGEEDTEPKLIVKDLKGAQVDQEQEAYSGLMLLDAGFYGEQGEYLWTLALDVFGTAPNTIMNTFQVGKMNYHTVSLGEALTYKVIYENARLRVFTTQQVYTYDYKGTQESNSTMLVYGWKLIDADMPDRGRAKLLLAPTSQTSSAQLISELISEDYIYRADMSSQKFFGYQIPAPDGVKITAFYGITDDGRMLLASGETMYSLTLPER